MGKVVALGGGVFMGKHETLMPKEMRFVHQEIVRLTGKKHPNVLCVPTPSNDLASRVGIFEKYYKELGCQVDALYLLKNPPDKAEIESKISKADAIFVTGGNTHRAIATWKRHGVDVLLKRAYEQDTVMAGYSAGAICWFAYGNSDSFSKDKIFRVSAMGIFNALLCPHYDSEPHRQPALKKMMKRTPGMIAIALDEYAGLEIINGKYRLLTARPNAKIRRTHWKAGTYVVEEFQPREEVQDLTLLFEKGATIES